MPTPAQLAMLGASRSAVCRLDLREQFLYAGVVQSTAGQVT